MFDTEVAEAHFDDQSGTWYVITTEGEEFTARILISAVGQLNRPATPDIKGLEDFAGTQFHSAKWDYEHDLTGKRVAVIGIGASALQFIPRIAPRVDKLIVFQRSPNWVVPKNDREYGQLEKWAFRHLPGAARFHRYMIYWSWEKFWPKFQKDSPAAKSWRDQVDHIMRTQIEDRDLVTRLIPDYPVGCKRVLLSDDFLEAPQRPNVEVVSAPISRIEAGAVVTNDGGAHPADTLILATGFRTNEFLAPMKICGRDSRRLDDDWRTGAEAYYGMTVSGYPNFFILYGPNTNLGHRVPNGLHPPLHRPGSLRRSALYGPQAKRPGSLQHHSAERTRQDRLGRRLQQLVQNPGGQGGQQLVDQHLPLLVAHQAPGFF